MARFVTDPFTTQFLFYGKNLQEYIQKQGFQDTMSHLSLMREAEDPALVILECWGAETFPKTIK
jgi:hypothetical protein